MNDQSKPEIQVDFGENDDLSIGTIVSVKNHPYNQMNTGVKISAYNRTTPPLMIIIETHYGTKYSPADGNREDKDSFRCMYYSTVTGGFELNWFKRREIKTIKTIDSSLVSEYKDKTIEFIKKSLLGKTAILISVDLELGKVKILHSQNGPNRRAQERNLLDYLPPVGSIIDVKLNEDYQKYNEKNGKPIFLKAKILVKLRWLNGLTSKFSEDYVPLSALKIVEVNYQQYDNLLCYPFSSPMPLEENKNVKLNVQPLMLKDVVWKHYYYEYRFASLISNNTIIIKGSDLEKLQEPIDPNGVIYSGSFEDKGILAFFDAANRINFEGSWFEIEYSDKNEKYTKRVVYIQEIQEEELGSDAKSNLILKANCLLRDGKIRHFRIDRIKSYRKMPDEFVKTFVANIAS